MLPDFGWSAETIVSNMPSWANETDSLAIHARQIPAQRWEIQLETVPLEINDYMALNAFINKQQGVYGVFDVVVPLYSNPRGSVPVGGVTVNTVANIGDTQIELDGFFPNTQDVYLPGDFIRFSSQSKVYQIINRANSDGNGLSTIEITPPLTRDLPDMTSVITRNVPFTVRSANDEHSHRVSGSQLRMVNVSVNLLEVIETAYIGEFNT